MITARGPAGSYHKYPAICHGIQREKIVNNILFGYHSEGDETFDALWVGAATGQDIVIRG